MSLLDRVVERRAALGEEADRLHKQLAEVEDELERVAVAEQVVMQLIEQGSQPDERVGGVTYLSMRPAAGGAPPARMAIPHRHEADGQGELPEDYQPILAIVTETVTQTGAPVQAKTVCQALEGTAEPGRVETTRSKLKRLAERGWLHRNGAGMFTTL